MTAPGRAAFTAPLLAGLLLCGMAPAQSRTPGGFASSDFSYYLLVLSYAPDFCDQPGGNKDWRECGAGRHVGFVVHGLWPQGDDSRGPENCGPASPVSRAIVQATLNYIPTEALIQHEWAAHGTCSGWSAADYFAALRKARDSLTLPADLNQPSRKLSFSPGQIASRFAAANPKYPQTAFRASCYRDAELEEVRVCLGRDLSPRGCGSGAGKCTFANVTLLPVH